MKGRRQILGITQAQLAEKVNTSTNYIALIETEKRFPHSEMLERIASALDIDPPALFSTKRRNGNTALTESAGAMLEKGIFWGII